MIALNEMKEAVKDRLAEVPFEDYSHPELGRCKISQRLLSLVQPRLHQILPAKIRRQQAKRKSKARAQIASDLLRYEIAVQSHQAWIAQLQWMEAGQQERFLVFGNELLPIFVAWDGESVVVDSKEVFPFE